jgi:hypothetical protein
MKNDKKNDAKSINDYLYKKVEEIKETQQSRINRDSGRSPSPPPGTPSRGIIMGNFSTKR